MNQDHEQLFPDKSRSTDLLAAVDTADFTGAAIEPFAGDPFGSFASGPAKASAVFSPKMLLLYKWWIVTVALIVSTVSLAGIWLFTTPRYQATAVLRVAPVISRIVFRNEDNGRVPLYNSYLNTQVSIVKSPAVLQRVLEQDDIRQTGWYHTPPEPLWGKAPSHMERLLDDLTVRPRPHTELIEVGMITDAPADAKIIVDSMVEAFQRYSRESIRETDVHRYETLTTERENLHKEIEGLIATKFNIAQALGTLTPEEVRSHRARHLSELQAEMDSLERRYLMTRWELEILDAAESEKQEQQDDDNGGDEHIKRRYALDPEWRQLHLDVKDMGHELELARQQYGDLHPKIKQLQSRADHTAQLLSDREQQLDEVGPGGSLAGRMADGAANLILDRETLDHLSRRQQKELTLLRDEISRQDQRVGEAGEIAREIAHFDEEIRRKRELYASVRSRIQELEMEGKAPARITVASRAVQPTRPYRDRRILMSLFALACGLACGVGVAFLRFTMDPRIRAVEDVQDAVHVPFLGQLPWVSPYEDILNAPDSLLDECSRMIRTALLQRLEGTDRKSILVTSSSSRSGKTTVSILLAKSIASLGKRVLLVEADLRRPTVSQVLVGFESKIGLAGLLAGIVDEEEAIVPSNGRGFDVLVAGQLPDGFDFEWLANGRFSECLERWKRDYDLVLLDSPPVLPVADSRILTSQVDGTLMVLRSSHTRRGDVLHAFADLGAAGGTLLGTILVGVRGGGGYGYGYYGYGSDYARGRALPSALTTQT